MTQLDDDVQVLATPLTAGRVARLPAPHMPAVPASAPDVQVLATPPSPVPAIPATPSAPPQPQPQVTDVSPPLSPGWHQIHQEIINTNNQQHTAMLDAAGMPFGVPLGQLYNAQAGLRAGALNLGKGLAGLAETTSMVNPNVLLTGQLPQVEKTADAFRESMDSEIARIGGDPNSLPYKAASIIPPVAGAISSAGLGAAGAGAAGLGAIGQTLAGGAASAAIPTGQTYSDSLQAQLNAGVPEDQARHRAATEAAIMAPVTAGLQSIPVGAGVARYASLPVRAAVGAAVGAGQGAAQQVAHDVVAEKVRGAEGPTKEKTGYAALEGALFGAGFGLLHGRQQQPTTEIEPSEAYARFKQEYANWRQAGEQGPEPQPPKGESVTISRIPPKALPAPGEQGEGATEPPAQPESRPLGETPINAAPQLEGRPRQRYVTNDQLRRMTTQQLRAAAQAEGVEYDSRSLTTPRILDSQAQRAIGEMDDKQLWDTVRGMGLEASTREENAATLLDVWRNGLKEKHPAFEPTEQKGGTPDEQEQLQGRSPAAPVTPATEQPTAEGSSTPSVAPPVAEDVKKPAKNITENITAPAAPREVEGQFAIPGTEEAVQRQEQAEAFVSRIRAEYPSLRNDKPGALALSKYLHDTTESFIHENEGPPQTEEDFDNLRDVLEKRARGGYSAFGDEEMLPDNSLLQRVVANIQARTSPESGTIQEQGPADGNRPSQPTVPQPPVEAAGQPTSERLGENGPTALATVPSGADELPAQQGAVELGDAGRAGRGGEPLRGAGGQRDESGLGEGDSAQGVHLDRPAGAVGPERADGGGEQSGAGLPEDAGSRGELDVGNDEPERSSPSVPANAGNYVIPDADALHAGGLKQKFNDNVAAIETLRKLEAERRHATPEEQAVLAKYTGWGAMPGAFNKYDVSAGDWTKERDTISGLLTPEEHDAASRSTLNAHYTSGPIVKGMWDMARRLGFKGGRVLEPAVGVGNFFGLMPPELRGKSSLTGVELDKLTARIAKHLYPRANVLAHGFEDLKTPHGFFDFAISNVPFGDYRVHDKPYNHLKAPIHDYFFAKGLDQVRPGGLVMFISSTGTMDKGDPRVRKALAEKADLVAAIRLPEGAFQKNAGTQVVTDLLILKRRPEGAEPSGHSWTNITTVPDPDGGEPIPINEYFAAHPEQVLGRVDRKSRLYSGDAPHVSMTKGFEKQWQDAIARVPENAYEPRESPAHLNKTPTIAPATMKEGSYVRGQNGKLHRRENGELVEAAVQPKQQRIIENAMGVRNVLRDVINAQVEGRPQEQIDAARKKLNQVYDAFVKKHGPLHKPENAKAFAADPDAPVILALEHWDPKTKTAKKADAFRQNTVRGYERPTKAADASEAIGISLNESGHVDVDRIASLLGQKPEAVGKELVEKGLAFEDPAAGWQSAEQYLSGNVRRKLVEAQQAAKLDKKYQPNVKALEKVQPPDVPYDEIDARLGVPWVGPEDIAGFAAELFQGTPEDFAIKYIPSSGEWLADWSDSGGRRHRGTPQDVQIYGTQRQGFADILEAALNNKVITVRDKISSNPLAYKVNQEESAAANGKVDELQQRFRDWIWQDDDRRHRLHRTYNDTFNNIAPVRYNGSHLKFPGMSPAITLRDHQRNAVWRTIVKGTALYAHEVGTGKTWTMVASAMELRRLGLARKPAVAVLKSTLPGFMREARELYPNAKILAVDKFEAKDRKRIVSQIATGDHDLVILTHDHIDMLPMKSKTQQAFIQREISELQSVISDVNSGGDDSGFGRRRGKSQEGNRLVKKLEKAKARLRQKLQEALDSKHDDAITFEETGIDQLFVDEAHKYKSLPVYTKQDRVKGIPQGRSDRATQMAMRTRWLQEQHDGRGIVMATGTPITNTMAELYTMQRYLQSRELEERGIEAFDAWARNFGIITSRMEFTVTGDYSPVSRFSKFVNLPELGKIAGEVIDVQRAKDLPGFKRPKRKDQVVTVPMSPSQRAYLGEIRARAVEAKRKRPGEPGDNMLSISGDARKAALDMRLVDPRADARDSGKIDKVVENVVQVWKEDPTRTQMIFSDIGIHPTKWGYSPFHEITDRLVAAGIPRDKIINFSELTDVQKRTASHRLKTGDALIGLGSTDKMGTGVNAQDHLYALHHMDVTWLPGYVEQRDGRGWRQGNRHPQIQIYRYTTEGSFDTFMWQTVDAKTRFINQFIESMATGKPIEQRAVQEEDPEGELTPAQIMAVTSGNPLLLDKLNLDRDVNELEGASRRHERNSLKLRDTAKNLDMRVREVQEEVAALQKDLGAIVAAPEPKGDEFNIELGDKTYTDREQAQLALLSIRPKEDWTQIGAYRGLPLYARKPFGSEAELRLGEGLHSKASLLSLEYAARPSTVQADIRRAQGRAAQFKKDSDAARLEATKSFPKAEDLAEKKKQLADVQAKMAAQSNPPQQQAPQQAPQQDDQDDPTGIEYNRSKGFIDLSALEPVFNAGLGAVRYAKAGLDWWSKPLIERIEDQAGKVGKDMADTARRSNDTARQITGELAADLHRAQVAAAGRTAESHRAVEHLQRIIWSPGKDYGYGLFQQAVEDIVSPATLPAKARQIVENHRRLMKHSGDIAVREGFKTWDGKGWVPFTPAKDGKRLIRSISPEGYDILRRGENDPAFQAWANAIADANGVPVQHAIAELNDLADPLFKRNAVEGRRHLKMWPTHLRLPGDQIVPVMHAEPFAAASALVRNFSLRAGYVRTVGQDLPIPGIPRKTVSELLVEGFGKAGGDRDELRELLRALNGMPLQPRDAHKWRPAPGTPEYQASKMASFVFSAARSGALTMAFVPNLYEPLSKTLGFSGFGDWARAYVDILRHPKLAAAATAALGARTQDVMNLVAEPGRSLEFVARLLHVMAKPMDWVNEFNELHAGVVGIRMMNRLRSGQATADDHPRLRVLGFNADQVRRLTSGAATPDEYQAVATRMAERTQGSTSLPADVSKATNSPLYRRYVMFDRFPQMTANRTARVLRQMLESIDAARKGKGSWDDVYRSSKLTAKYLGGTAASGALTMLTLAFLFGGAAGLKVAFSKAKDDPRHFLAQAFLYPSLGGMSAAVYRAAMENSDRNWTTPLGGVVLPVMLIQELVDFAEGYGPYKDRDNLERTAQFFRRRIPAARTVSQVAGMIGLGSRDTALDSAIRGFYDWRRQNPSKKGQDVGGTYAADGEQLQFRIRMRRAYEAMSQGKDQDAEKLLEEAIGVKFDADEKDPAGSVADSLRGKKLLKQLSEDEQVKLRKNIGEEAFAKLEAHDDALEGWARAIKPPPVKKLGDGSR